MFTNVHQCHPGEISTLFPYFPCPMPLQHFLQLNQRLWEGEGRSLLFLLHRDPLLPRPGKLSEIPNLCPKPKFPSNFLGNSMPRSTNSWQAGTWHQTESSVQVRKPPLYLSSFLILKLINFIQSSGHLVPLLKILKFHKPTPMEAPGPNATFMVIYKHWVLPSISHQSFGLFPWNPEMIWASPWGWYYHNVPHKWNMNF